MNIVTSFEDLLVWQKSHRFVIDIYSFVRNFPKDEQYALTAQLRRAAISIPANIAEGFKKRGIKDKARYISIAHGSLSECHYYLILAKDLSYGSEKSLFSQLHEISKMLLAYYKSLIKEIK